MVQQFSEKAFSLRELFTVVRRNLFGGVIALLLAVEVAILLIMYLPPKYKATAVVDIQSSYFGSPLTGDLVRGTQDPAELRAQREALLRVALSDEFIDSLAESLGLMTTPDGRPLSRQAVREGMRKRITYFPGGPTNLNLSATAGSAAEAHDVVQRVLNRFVGTLINTRYTALVQSRDAIQAQVEFLGRALDDQGKVEKSQELRERLQNIDEQIQGLQQRYTALHPEMVDLRQKADSLRRRLKNVPAVSEIFREDEVAKSFLVARTEQPLKDIYHDLLQKLSYLNITLKMESAGEKPYYLAVLEEPGVPMGPVFPNVRDFLALGFVFGLVLAVLQAVYFELRRLEHLGPAEAARELEVPLLGTLPVLPEGKNVLRLEGRQRPLGLPEAIEGTA